MYSNEAEWANQKQFKLTKPFGFHGFYKHIQRFNPFRPEFRIVIFIH